MNLTDKQEKRYLNKWAKNHGDPSMDQYDINGIKNNIKDIVDCLNQQLIDVEKFRFLDNLIGFMLLRDSDYFLHDIAEFDSKESAKEKQEDMESTAKEFQKRYNDIFGGEMFKSQDGARNSVLSKLSKKNNVFSISTKSGQDSFSAAISVNKKAETLAAFFVALDIYPKLNKTALNNDPDNTVIKFMSHLFAEIEIDIKNKFNQLVKADEEDKGEEGYKAIFEDPEELKDHCLKFVEESNFTYYDIEKSTLKTIIHSMGRYIWKDLEETDKAREQARFFNKIIELIKFIHFYMVRIPDYKYDIDIDIHKKEIGEMLTDILRIQSTYKTKRREKIKDKEELDDWYYDVFYDEDFFAKYSSYEYKENETEEEERQKSDVLAQQVKKNYDDAFSLTAEKTGDHSYKFTMIFGIMDEDKNFFKEYVTVLRDNQKALQNIAFLPFDETLYDFISYFTDIKIQYNVNQLTISFSGETDFSVMNVFNGEGTEKETLQKIADDLAMLQNEIKIAEIIDQLRSSRRGGRYSPYQGYIYQLYINKDHNRIQARGSIKKTTPPDNQRVGSFYTSYKSQGEQGTENINQQVDETPPLPAAPEGTEGAPAPQANPAPQMPEDASGAFDRMP